MTGPVSVLSMPDTASAGAAGRSGSVTFWLCFALVSGAGIMSYLPWLGSYGPLDPTDSFFLESGREMVETGRFLLPLNNYEPWLDKPILYFWMVAGAYKLLGISPFVGRLPAALSAIATGLVIFAGLRGFCEPRIACLAALIFFGLPLVSVVGHVCLTDMTLACLVSGSILFLFRALHIRDSKELAVGYIFMALGVLCKGPIAPILTGLVLVPYILWRRRCRKGVIADMMTLRPVAGLAFVLLVNLPWYLAANSATGGKFFEAFFLQQNFGRMVGTVNHQMPFWFYLPVFAGGFFPWSALSLAFPRFIHRELASNAVPPRRAELLRLALCWFASIMLLFTAIKTKLPTYILPAVPAFAILTACYLENLAQSRSIRGLAWLGAMCLLALLGLPFVASKLPSYVQAVLSNNVLFVIASAGLLVAFLAAALRARTGLAVALLSLTMMFACAVFVPQGLRALYNYRQAGFNQLVAMTRGADSEVAIISAEEPSMPYILHKPVHRLQHPDDASRFLSRPGRHYVLVPREMIVRLDWFPGTEPKFVAESGKWKLFAL